MSAAPIILEYEGDGQFRAPKSFVPMCDKAFVVHERYRMAVQEERSAISHRHFFAVIREAWLNLPDDLALEYTSEDRLRKRALIATGYFTERRIVLSSAADARKMAAFLMQRADDGTVFAVAGNVVIERTARSQSTGPNGMRKAEFQKSKTDVLEWIAALINVELATLAANAQGGDKIPPDIRMAG